MNRFKKTIVVTLMALLLIPLVSMISSCAIVRFFTCMGKDSLTVYNWGEYVDPDLLTQFENENNVCVDYVTFNSNETAVTRVKSEVFDVIVPSDYAIEQLAKEGLIQKLDWDKIDIDPETDLADNLKAILDNLKDQENGFDFLEYAVPYFWGNVGIIYRSDIEGVEDDLAEQNWDIVKNPKYSVLYYDSSRDGFMVPLKQLGYSMNTSNDDEISEAEAWLNEQRSVLGENKLRYVGDEVLSLMQAGSYDLGVVYSGDAIWIMEENEDYDFYTPTNGTNVWADGMVIHKDSTKTDLAYKFINFMSTKDSSYANSVYTGYNASNKEAFLEALETDFADYAYIYNYELQENDEIYRYNPTAKEKIDEAWLRVKN
ncbi:TPA: ABC transporter substrate-binding protein [bacterium]|jgi:spermidine/putrescine-binding protein|nr:ABC transporter substrate-binding protein [bacterium]